MYTDFIIRVEKIRIYYYDANSLCTTIDADFRLKTVYVKNHTQNLWKAAFGKNDSPSWEDFISFLKERCIPQSRAGLTRYLDAINVPYYDPILILQKTKGRMAEDDQWLEMELS